MKNIILFVALLVLVSALDAAPVTGVAKVQFKDKKVSSWPDGKVLMAPDEIVLPFNIVVRTNGTFTVKGGEERKMLEGEMLMSDGMLLRPDGSIALVLDHVTLSRGRVLVTRDGISTELTAAMKLGDGTTVSPDGSVTPPNGSARKMLDGELFPLEGGKLPTRDTVTLKNGKVIVQKDGTQLVVEAARSITMNDGTKIMGDGTIIKLNGERTNVVEGQIFTLEGVVTKPR